MSTKLKDVLGMKEGTEEFSYANASHLQKQMLLLPKPIREKAITEVYCMHQPTTLCIADLGCSSSKENNLGVISELIQSVDKARRELGRGPQEYQIYLNDLPKNDFNTVFSSVANFEANLKQQLGEDFGHCFVNGVPGSFYGRLFPSNSLHFVHSSCSLHWLSQVPEGLEDNKKNFYISRTSPPSVVKAYYDQFQTDVLAFLHNRSKEVVARGKMVLTFLIRQEKKEPYWNKLWHPLAIILNDMVSEGFIEEEKLKTFNLPLYSPSLEELKFVIENEGSFAIEQLLVFGVGWEADVNHVNNLSNHSSFDSYKMLKTVRAGTEPLLISHFGEAIIEEVFQRYSKIIEDSMKNEKNNMNDEKDEFINVTVSLTRRISSAESTSD